jgi:RsiW-degrading membrane proteinase PrsW (M82 family)
MSITILLLHLWSVALALFWLRAPRVVSRRLGKEGDRSGPSVSGVGHFLAGSFAALIVFILAFGRPLPWLLADVYEAANSGQIIATALFEEVAKWGVFLLGIYGAGATRTRREGMEQGALVAVGFAVTQNSFYFLRYPELDMVIRPILVTGVNVAVASIWGYATAAFHLRGGASGRGGVTGRASVIPLAKLGTRGRES